MLWLQKFTPFYSYLSLAQSEVTWVQLCWGKNVFACQSFPLYTMLGRLWHGTSALELIFKVSLFMKNIADFYFCVRITHRSTSFEPNSCYSSVISEQSLLKTITACHLFLLIFTFIIFPSPHDLTSLPSSSYSNHALIVQRDAFFISAHQILKRLCNMGSVMQT